MALFIISAPSGSGKSTLVRELMGQIANLSFSISYTTRAPRGSEVNGCEYFFVDRARFDAMVAGGEFIEHAEVFGQGYGTARSFLEQSRREGRDLVLDIDVQGAEQVKRGWPEAVSIFIAPPDRDTLALRLKNRGLNNPEEMARRLREASREIAAYNKYDYVVINDRLLESAAQLCAIVRCHQGHPEACPAAAACRQAQVAARMQPVLASFGFPQTE
jgi:guanylate kinase